jgi:formiminotetrahydrofolate cyclodeaminase
VSSKPKLVELTAAAFARELASKAPTPGGGSAAAFQAAQGAALASMAFALTSGEKFAAVAPYMDGRSKELAALADQALALVDRDASAFDAVSAAFRLPKASDAEKSARTAAIQDATRGALEVPLETMETAARALRLAAAGAADVNPNVASDLGSGAWALAAASEGAYLNVRTNASGIKDRASIDFQVRAAEALRAESQALLADVRREVERFLGA